MCEKHHSNKSEENRITYEKYFQVYLWLTRPLLCKIGFHKFDWNEWGTGGCGVIDFYCFRCQKKITSIPIDDLPIERRELIMEKLSKGGE